MRTEKQKMLAGELYHAGDPEIQADQAAAKAWMIRYNAALGASATARRALLRELLPEVGDGAVIRPPFHCDFGYNISLGPDVFLNFNCVILDVVAVTIGAGTQIGPAVQIYTADHPRDPALRKSGAEFGRPVSIGQNVWIGGGVIILPGLSIGDDAVVGPVRWLPGTCRKARPFLAIRRGKKTSRLAEIRVPDAAQRSSRCSAEPGPYQAQCS
jgi:maltose O-acetyltransferase